MSPACPHLERNVSKTASFLSSLASNPFHHHLILVVSPSESSFRLVERNLNRLTDCELRWHSETIEALADIFMSRPALLVVFGDSNAEGLEFIQLVRNNRQFRELPVFAVLPEPVKLGQKAGKRLNIERFSTPLDNSHLFLRASQILHPGETPPATKT